MSGTDEESSQAQVPPGFGRSNPTSTPPLANEAEQNQTLRPGFLVYMLDRDQRYPILLAGSARSGKSTVIVSLIHAASRSGRDGDAPVDVSFGYSFFDIEANESQGKARQIKRYAEMFFQRSASDFMLARQHLDATQEDIPVVIPLDFTVRGRDKPLKLAIIDGRGEWYQPNDKPNVAAGETTFRDFPEDIKNIVEHYDSAISFMWVAPVVEKGATEIGDLGLLAALSKYQEYRKVASRQLDAHLYLLSKWDAKSSYHTGEYFERVTGQTIVDYVDEYYRASWDKFRNLPLGKNDSERRKFMHYCAWRFQNGLPVPLTPRQLDPFLRYPRTLLNWLLSNASSQAARRDGQLEAIISLAFFPDVMPSDTTFVSLSDRIVRVLTR